jgi:hypothetical protein
MVRKIIKKKEFQSTFTQLFCYEQLNKLNCLSQSLGGFNEALLMQKQTMQ